jgi:hypothetical protein
VHACGVCSASCLLGLLLLLRLGSLLRQSFGLLLLLDTRRRRARRSLQVHLRLERTCILLLRNERVCTSLLRRPTLERVDVEQTMDEVDECFSVGHFCFMLAAVMDVMFH